MSDAYALSTRTQSRKICLRCVTPSHAELRDASELIWACPTDPPSSSPSPSLPFRAQDPSPISWPAASPSSPLFYLHSFSTRPQATHPSLLLSLAALQPPNPSANDAHQNPHNPRLQILPLANPPRPLLTRPQRRSRPQRFRQIQLLLRNPLRPCRRVLFHVARRPSSALARGNLHLNHSQRVRRNRLLERGRSVSNGQGRGGLEADDRVEEGRVQCR